MYLSKFEIWISCFLFGLFCSAFLNNFLVGIEHQPAGDTSTFMVKQTESLDFLLLLSSPLSFFGDCESKISLARWLQVFWKSDFQESYQLQPTQHLPEEDRNKQSHLGHLSHLPKFGQVNSPYFVILIILLKTTRQRPSHFGHLPRYFFVMARVNLPTPPKVFPQKWFDHWGQPLNSYFGPPVIVVKPSYLEEMRPGLWTAIIP